MINRETLFTTESPLGAPQLDVRQIAKLWYIAYISFIKNS